MRAAVLRRGRAASALLAMVVAAAVATAMMNLYVDVQAKLRKEFRSYGANMVVVGEGRPAFLPDALDAKRIRAGGPRYGRALRLRGGAHLGRPVGRRVGTDFDASEVESLVVGECVADGFERSAGGVRAAAVVSRTDGKAFDLTFRAAH